LGNDRPKILVKVEDCVLQAIFDLCEGKAITPVIDALHLCVEMLQKDLGNDEEALNWFDFSRPAFSAPLTPPLRLTPLPGQFFRSDLNLII